MSYIEEEGHVLACPSLKPCFRTKAEIKDYIRRRNLRNGGDGFKYYRCTICGCWHLTTHKPVDDYMLKRKAKAYNRLEKKKADEKFFKNVV